MAQPTPAQSRLHELIDTMLASRSRTFPPTAASIAGGKAPVVLQNLEGSALASVAHSLSRELGRTMVIVTAGMERAEQLVDDLEFFGAPDPLHYPKWEILPYDSEDLSLEVTSKHLDVFEALASARAGNGAPVVTAPVDALMLRVLPPDCLESMTRRFAWGDQLDLGQVAETLDRAGYERVGIVEARGEFSLRGSVLDIYPPNSEDPYRIDLFGDEIESIRCFDVATQRSTRELGTEAAIAVPAAKLKHQIDARLRAGQGLVTFFDLLPRDAVILLDNPERYEEVCQYFESAVERQFNEVLHGESDLGPPAAMIIGGEEVHQRVEGFRRVEHTRLPVAGEGAEVFLYETRGYSAPAGDLAGWISTIRRLQHEDYLVVVVCDNDGQVQRFDEVLRENEISSQSLVTDEQAASYEPRSALEGYRDVLLVVGGMHEGFRWEDARLALVTDREIFGRYKRRHSYRKIYKGRPITGSNEIKRGDFVVHVEHGIGQYTGMRAQEIDNRTVDLLELVYAGGDKLLVPVEKIRFVQKYAGPDSDSVTMDRLGSNKWAKRRKKSSEEIEKLAEQLLELYAKREVARRDPFGPDTVWQAEFESSFPYQETPDQLKAIMEAKADLERHRPMDRLLCGDVGYGKTEVAIRAVFKAVTEGRQAAVLAPTTILALQHHRTFKERFADYPVKLALLSRFQGAKDIREVKKGIKAGEIQVVIGTHKVLAKDIEFKDLGLLVIDEEQRFGVKHKDRLKEMRADVDILTMTATPIPRTLHMALSGLRDLSVITTPPPDRHPIKTRIIHWEEEQIAEAILRELNRGGQVFFIHNRVHNIHEIARQIQKIVPHARIGVAHGQMKESELEDHMLEFMGGGYDILIATTIVESGIDIPNANTIIINRADAFGLAQLYQLRGRVGREKRRAYAYLIVPRGQAITEQAVKRLAAIEEFTELGAGFNIAMRDMEIRGAGNLLGKEQHGIVNEIGFELYCDMLQEAVARMRGDTLHDQHDVEVKWPTSSFIPAPYVPVETQRVNFYKRLATMRLQEDVTDLEAEMRDRYGEPPVPVRVLLCVARLRLAAAPHRVTLIEAGRDSVRFDFMDPVAQVYRPHLAEAVEDGGPVLGARAISENSIRLETRPGAGEDERILAATGFLNRLWARVNPAQEEGGGEGAKGPTPPAAGTRSSA